MKLFVFFLSLCFSFSLFAKDEESPWLIAPTASVDPKLGASLGFVFGYLYRIDPKSDRSLTATAANWSDTQSQTQAIFSKNYFDGNSQKLILGMFHAKVNNEYDDFLGTGDKGNTTDNITGAGFRYLHRMVGQWYWGLNAFYMKYSITPNDATTKQYMKNVGLDEETDSVGAGLIIEYDSRDNPNSPLSGTQFNLSNIANREQFGSDSNYDVYRMNYKFFVSSQSKHVLATLIKGHWVSDDTPQGAWSSVLLRGYVRGEYLAPNYISAETEGRIHISERWLWTISGGVGCLYVETADCNDNKNIYPMGALGLQFVLKVEDRLVARAEYAKGKGDNQGFYIKFGQAF